MFNGNILITGGTGTLGRAIVEAAQTYQYDCQFTIYSRSELRQAEMAAKFPNCRYVLGDIRDEAQLRAAVAGHDVVIHAAAMKRIPECEMQPIECMNTNVQGSINVVRACIAARVPRCVGISTDKACAAITTYGASKRAMEGIFQQASSGNTLFNLVRYGNVVASNGSVIPLWQRQARDKQPLSLTGGDMTRFWMSKESAVALIAQALQLPAATIRVPKMGSLSIREMAEIIAPGAPVVELGLRSREKKHEDLVHPDETVHAESSGYYTLMPANGASGIHYSSHNARRLGADEFRAMVEAA